MSNYNLPNGSSVQLSKLWGKKNAVTGISNSLNAEVMLSAPDESIGVGDIVLLRSAWIHLDGFVARVKSVQDLVVTLDDVDTSDTVYFPEGGGAGSLTKVGEFIDFPPVTAVAAAGGDQQTTSFQALQMDRAENLNTFKNASTQTYTLTHDSADEIRPILKAADKSQDLVVVKFFNSRSSEARLYSAKVSFNEIPATEINQVETVQVVFSLKSDMKFYKG